MAATDLSRGRAALKTRPTIDGFSAWGAAALAVWCVLSTPGPQSWSRPDATPFDNGPTRSVAPAVKLLREAAGVLPDGATVVARRMPPSAQADTYFHRAAAALLPRQVVLPAALWAKPTPELEARAQFVVILGEAAAYRDLELVLRTASGSVWRKAPRP